eukprot:m.233090 g.233090  ORF g.233090 m.233090 type:complete len:83 (+) comp12457_c0_seq1:37-285(+)
MAFRSAIVRIAGPARFASEAAGTKTAASAAKPAATASKAPATGTKYFGRTVPYTDVHTSQLETFYATEITVRSKRLPQPVPK